MHSPAPPYLSIRIYHSLYFLFRLFELEPEAKVIFGFDKDVGALELAKHDRFNKHATYFIQMIDKALGMLGPDIELLTEILMDLGLKHVKVRFFAGWNEHHER